MYKTVMTEELKMFQISVSDKIHYCKIRLWQEKIFTVKTFMLLMLTPGPVP